MSEISVLLPPEQWNIVLGGVAKLSIEVAAPTFNEIQRQVQAAMQSAHVQAEPEPAT